MNQLGRDKLDADDIPVVQAILDMIITPRFEVGDKVFVGGVEETVTEVNYTYKLTCSDSNNYEDNELLPAIDVEGFQDWCRKHGLRFSDNEYKAYLDLKGHSL